MIEPVSVPILLDLELEEEELDLSVEEAEEYAAQIGSLIAVSEVYGGLPSGGSAGQALIKDSDEDYDAIWSDIDRELPDVDSTDYGKVLTVSNDGIWNAQQPIFMVTITNNNNVFSADKTFSEITNAAIHNMMVVATYAGAYYQYCGTGGGAAVRQFVYIFTRDNIQAIKLFSVNINNVWTQYQYQLGTYSKPDSGIPASDLADDVHLIPSGGSEGYVLKKNSSNDYDVIWTEDNITEIKYFDFTWDGEHNPIPAIGVTGEAIFDAIADGKLIFARVTVGGLSYPYIFSLHAYYSNTLLEFVSVNGSIVDVLGYEYFFGQDTWSINEYIIPDPAQDIPADLGVAAVGSSSAFARADHVHAMPSAADIGAYELPSGGIPSTDLSAAVQTSLGKADTAIQEHQSLADYRKATDQDAIDEAQNTAIAAKYSKPSDGIPASDLVSGITIPSGGSTGQVLKKTSGMDYDTEWADETSGISDYNTLNNKPQIAGVTLSGDKSLSDLGIEPRPMLVTLSWTGSGDTYTADKTYAEITGAIAAGQEVLADWGSSILHPSEPGATWIGYDDSQILEFILHEDSSWTGIITDLDSYRTAADQDVIDRQQNAAIEAKYTKPSGGIPATDLAAGVIPTVPSNVSAFENDAGYLTLSDLPIYDGGVS